MKKDKMQKGMYGYLKQKKIKETIKTFVLFAISAAVYVTGLLQTGTNQNVLTIVAIIGVLPASKSAVNMIMFLSCRAVSAELYEQAREVTLANGGILLCDLLLVLLERRVKTDCIYIRENTVFVYTRYTGLKEAEMARELKKLLANQGKGSVTVKVSGGEQAFMNQLKKNGPARNEDGEDHAPVGQAGKIKDMLLAFSM